MSRQVRARDARPQPRTRPRSARTSKCEKEKLNRLSRSRQTAADGAFGAHPLEKPLFGTPFLCVNRLIRGLFAVLHTFSTIISIIVPYRVIIILSFHLNNVFLLVNRPIRALFIIFHIFHRPSYYPACFLTPYVFNMYLSKSASAPSCLNIIPFNTSVCSSVRYVFLRS